MRPPPAGSKVSKGGSLPLMNSAPYSLSRRRKKMSCLSCTSEVSSTTSLARVRSRRRCSRARTTLSSTNSWRRPLTFVAAANAIVYQGGVPVFVDSDRATWNLDSDVLSSALRERAAANRLPKALVVVHLYGQSADMDPILQACAEYGITVIEDAAEAVGTLYKGKPAGTLGDIGVYSFNGIKIITTTGGGMLVSRSQAWVD